VATDRPAAARALLNADGPGAAGAAAEARQWANDVFSQRYWKNAPVRMGLALFGVFIIFLI
jgi:hypothetical protein